MPNIPMCNYCGAIPGEEHHAYCPMIISKTSKHNDYLGVTSPISDIKEPIITRVNASELLKHTEELINGERSKDYGDPHQSFKKIAELWTTYLHHEITVTDVGIMMILLKVARNRRGRNKPDNFVDICGYAALTGSQVFSKDKK